MNTSRVNDWAKALALCGLVVGLDQWVGDYVQRHVARGTEVEVLPFLSIVNIRNDGVAFGLFAQASSILIGLTLVILLCVLVYLGRNASGLRIWLPAGLLLGGALGNLIDRAQLGAVVDYIKFPHWPAFNVADIAINLGVLALILLPSLSSRDRGSSDGVSTDPQIVHIDDDVIVVSKPAGLVVHPAPSHKGETLSALLSDLTGGGEGWRAGIVHRLDKDTSGLMVVARNEEAHRDLADQIRARHAKREYTAMVEGKLSSRSGTIDAPIGRDRRTRTKMAVRGSGSRKARTHFEVTEVLPHDTLLLARLETGRTHQIRAHFAAIRHPVAGDPRYGSPGRHGLERQFLHSRRLAFRHPRSGEQLEFTSELPADLMVALERARGGEAPNP